MPKKKNAIEEEVAMDMTPMIDVTFQLLIFFIITLKFKLLEKKLTSYLPTDFGLSSNEIDVSENFLVVKLTQAGSSLDPIRDRTTRFFVENEEVTGSTQEEILGKISAKIRSFREAQKDVKGKIDTGVGVPHATVVQILDLFNRAKYETVSFVGLTRNENIAQGQKWWNKVRRDLGDM